MNFIERFITARKVGTPLIAVRTPDPASTIGLIVERTTNGKPTPILLWDIARGVVPVNPAGGEALLSILGGDEDPAMLTNPVELLSKALKLPDRTILFISNAQRFMTPDAAAVIQAIWNCRDPFKGNHRTLVMTCPDIKLPAELEQDVLILDEPLPDREQLAAILKEIYTSVQYDLANPKDANAKKINMPDLKPAILERAVDAVCGLATFTTEQVAAMSISPEGYDIDAMWERKRQQIEATGGLSVYRGKETFKDVKGVNNLAEYLTGLMEGEDPASVIVFMDEIEKMFAGMGNSQDSTTKEQVGRFLAWCEEKLPNGELAVVGVMLLGHPGTGKSLIAKALGNQFKKPTVIFDVSNTKASLLGESQQKFNSCLKVIDAVAGGKPKILIATCNSVDALPPEVRRRFCYGTFVVDLPDAEGRDECWKLYLAKYKLADKDRPKDFNWTGAEIRNCCMIAWKLRISLKAAAAYVVPVAEADPARVEKLRRDASNKYISANKPGKFNWSQVENEPGTPNIGKARRAISQEA